MADAGVVRRVILPAVLLGLTALGLMNTYGDSANVEKLAGQTACGGEAGCALQLTEFSRSAFSHEYLFVVGKGQRVAVKCARSAIFFGDYTCQKK